ncbi:MAG: aspartate/glutamate racemase family protein [Ardenticatenaceae bacterium]|nr:aspartate/glutamate racemase family protein [Anaerolineales bacterium]MCB8920335.1 aspartate/glutamate racemase family protein [Ardenticatenaceae bacterium]
MKTIGLLGGMSWESSLEYYRIINETVKTRLGGLHSAKSLMFSFDFEEIEALQSQGDWQEATRLMVEAARQLERGGADFVIICTNTMHKMANEVEVSIGIPLLHIADATAAAVKAQGLQRVGLLGTNFTMTEEFYRGRLQQVHGLDVLVPGEAGRQVVHDVIYGELCLGVTKEDSRAQYRGIMADLAEQGAEGIIFGCTEIGLLVTQEDSPVPVFDTTRIHAETAVAYALRDE